MALQETLMDVKRITDKGSQAIGNASVDAASNVSESSKIGFPQNLITIAAAIGQGVSIIRSVKKAVSKTKAQAVSGAASIPSASSGAAPTQAAAPQFNIVGKTATSQLANVIASKDSQPIKTYVTTSDVSTAQAMDRNIVQGASIG